MNESESYSEEKLFEGEDGSESSGSNSGLGSLENSREDSGGTGKSNHQVFVFVFMFVFVYICIFI